MKPPVPTAKNAAQVRCPIDAFVLQKIEVKGLRLNPEAARVKLIRRAYFDLTGLPPSPEEVKSFVEDRSAGS